MSAVAIALRGSRVLHRTRIITVGAEKRVVTRCTEQRVAVIWLSRDSAARSWGRTQDCADCAQRALVAAP